MFLNFDFIFQIFSKPRWPIKWRSPKQDDLIKKSSSSHKVSYESIKCDQYNILKNKINDLQNILDKFTKGRSNLNLLLGNQKASYNKDGIGYETKNNSESFINICKSTSHCKALKCNYCNKGGHIVMFYFIKKRHESKEGYPLSYFYKEYCKYKNRKMYAHNMYSTNIK